jgi:pilus assembly protein CpaF
MSTDALVESVCADARGVRGDVRAAVEAAADRRAPLAPEAERARLVAAAIARLSGLDVLEQHLEDIAVDEVVVNTGGEVWIDRSGRLVPGGRLPDGAVDVVLERVLAPTGRRIDRANPIVDVRLPSGARLCAVVAPVAVGGTALAIRRHRSGVVPIDAFTAEPGVADLLRDIVRSRCNGVISGATSSGKTTLAAALLASTDGDRLVVCEDTAELPLPGRHVVRLEARPEHADGGAGIDLARLVRTALRLRPDRLVVGEFRGAEVLAAIEAMNTGHDGSLSTCHANSAVDALHRLETLVMQSAPTWPLTAIRRHVARSLDVVLHVERASDGSRRIAEIVEVALDSGEHGEHRVRPLVRDGRVVGELRRRRRMPPGPSA